ncbi:MAG: phosphoenolpyruvate--protein phosphotransferase [Phycisphaerales bacterium]
MEIKKGIPVSPGVAICPAVVMDTDDIRVPRRTIAAKNLKHEHQRLDQAITDARKEVEVLRDQVAADLGPEPAKIFGFHLGMLQDPSLIAQVHSLIDRELVTAQFAFSTVMRQLAQTFLQQPSVMFKERVSDVWDLEKRVLKQLIAEAREELSHLDHEGAIIAHDLTPSQTASLNRKMVRAMATDLGGRTSHTAIVARALGIPAVVGLEDATGALNSGDTVIVDGNRGLLIIDPDPDQLEEYRGYVERYQAFETELGGLLKLPAVTTDGVTIGLLANIEFPDEIPEALGRGATGVGLYRTEFMFLSTEAEPSEDQQYQQIIHAMNLLGNRPMTIRTLDLGADKFTQRRMPEPEPNPFLGCRSIRLCLQDLTMFKTHLRAILRASAHGKIKIMFPLITNMMELRQARMILNDVMEDLDEDGLSFDTNVPVGMMIEVPSAALMAKVFTQEVDFFSIGTNDLIQYTLAVDRSNERVASLYSAAHPAVLMLIKDVIRAAKRRNIDVTCCGEMAGEVEFAMMLLGMGLRKLSMTPSSIPEIKKLVRSVSIEQCERVARRAASYDSERQVLNYLREETRKIIPEAFDGRSIG